MRVPAVVGDFRAKDGHITETEKHLGGSFTISIDHSKPNDGLIQISDHYELFMVNTKLCHRFI